MRRYEAVKDAIIAVDRLRDAEVRQKLADVQVECAKLAAEGNGSLRQELLTLRETERLRDDMKLRDNVYWHEQPDVEPDGPFCPACFDGQSRTARMIASNSGATWICATCRRQIADPRVDPPKQPRGVWCGPRTSIANSSFDG